VGRKEPDRFAPWVAVAATLVGAFLRFYRLGAKSFCSGEVQEALNSRSDWAFTDIQASGTDVIGWYWHNFLWRLGVESDLELWGRVLAAACGTAAVPLVYVLGTRLHSRAAGAAASVMLALSFFHVNHSQDARSLSYMTLGAVLVFVGLVRIVLDSKPRWTWGYLPGCLLLAGSHFFGFILFGMIHLAFLVVGLVLEARGNRAAASAASGAVRRLLLAAIPGSALGSVQLWASSFFFFTKDFDVGEGCPDPLTLADNVQFLRYLLTYLSGWTGWWVVPPGLLALLGILMLWWRSRVEAVLLSVWLLFPSGVLWAGKLAGKLVRLDASHMLFLVPAFCIAVSVGLVGTLRLVLRTLPKGRGGPSTLQPVLVVGAALSMALAGNGSELVRWYQRDTRLFLGHGFKEAAREITKRGVTRSDLLAFVYSPQYYEMTWYLGPVFRRNPSLTPVPIERLALGQRILLHVTDHVNYSWRRTLQGFRVMTPDGFLARGERYTGTVWAVLPVEEDLEPICGVSAYARFFETHEVYVGQRRVSPTQLPPGFELVPLPGIDLFFKRYEDAPRVRVVREVIPLLVDHAPGMSRGFIGQEIRSGRLRIP